MTSIVMLFANSPNYSFHSLIVFPQKRNSGQWWWRRASGRLHWGKQLIWIDFWLLLGVHVAYKTQNVLRSHFPNPLAFEGASGLEKLPSYREGFDLVLRSQVLILALALIHLPSISLGNHFVKWSLNLLWNGRDIWCLAAKRSRRKKREPFVARSKTLYIWLMSTPWQTWRKNLFINV